MSVGTESLLSHAKAAAGSRKTVLLRASQGVLLVLALFTTFHALGAGPWLTDEPVYRDAGVLYVQQHDFSFNQEHPPLGKYLIGVSQYAFGHSEWATRLPAALATLATGILLALLVARAIGQVPAMATFAAWTLLPQPYSAFDISRAAYLDTIMVAFTTFGLYAAWRWRESASWRWATAAGVSMGLASATKLSALSLAPAVLVLLPNREGLERRLKQLALGVAAGCFAFLVTYAPFGASGAVRAIDHMLRFQLGHGKRGHRVLVDGRIYRHPPWWAQASWLWDASHITMLLMVVSVLLVPFLVRRRISALLLTATLFPAALMAFVSPILLPHWMYVWAPTMAALIGIAIGVSLTRGRAWLPVGLVLAAALAVPAFKHVRSIAELHPSGYHLIEGQLQAVDQPGNIVIRFGPSNLSRYLYWAKVRGGNPGRSEARHVAAVVIDTRWPSRYAGGAVPPIVAAHPSAFQKRSTGVYVVWLRR